MDQAQVPAGEYLEHMIVASSGRYREFVPGTR